MKQYHHSQHYQLIEKRPYLHALWVEYDSPRYPPTLIKRTPMLARMELFLRKSRLCHQLLEEGGTDRGQIRINKTHGQNPSDATTGVDSRTGIKSCNWGGPTTGNLSEATTRVDPQSACPSGLAVIWGGGYHRAAFLMSLNCHLHKLKVSPCSASAEKKRDIGLGSSSLSRPIPPKSFLIAVDLCSSLELLSSLLRYFLAHICVISFCNSCKVLYKPWPFPTFPSLLTKRYIHQADHRNPLFASLLFYGAVTTITFFCLSIDRFREKIRAFSHSN